MAKLVVRSGRNAGADYKLSGERILLGRRSANEVPIEDAKASREHAVIHRRENIFYLQDLSRNGTLLNGSPASKLDEGNKLKFGDQIKIGDTVLEVVDEKTEALGIDIPGYKIMEVVGSGGMGTVYKARQISMDRIVAIKVLNERYSANTEFVERFIQEARAAGKLNHPNVIHVHDISRANGRHYFSMEFIDGSSVKELLRTRKKFEINEALDVVLQASKALEFAHENRIVHRDIKPDNIMLTKDGIVKIADLGIAKTFDGAPADVSGPAGNRRVLGTPHYMAPEQALGKVIDHRVDIYSLGATFYHMVTGSTPFKGQNAQDILKAHIQESLPAIQDLNAAVPDPVCFIIERMMAKMPEKRYPDMTALITDIERVQRGKVEGIKRVEEGASSIMPAAPAPKGGKRAPRADTVQEDAVDDAPTGAQKIISRVGLVAALVVVFAGVAASVVLISRYLNTVQDGAPTAGGTGAKPDLPGVNTHSNPEAKKLLLAAVAAQEKDPSEYERLLREIRDKFATSSEFEEAKRRLDDYANYEKDTEKKKAAAVLADAKTFEGANPDNLDECINKFRLAVASAQNVPGVLDEAKASFERLKKKQDDEKARAVEAAFKTAFAASSASKAKHDYDAARLALQEAIKNNDAAPQKADADAELARINTEAQARFKETQDAAVALDIPAALAAWNSYSAEVKDAAAANDLQAARDALEAKSKQLVQDELAKVTEKARKYDFLEAFNIVHTLQKRLHETQWAEMANKKDLMLKIEKTLHDKLGGAINERLKTGNVPLDFTIETRFGDVKWAVSGFRSEQLSLDAISTKSAPGFTKRLSDFSAKEQYQFHLLFLPKPLSTDDHKALSAFCMEHDLSAEAQAHDQKAAEPAPAPAPGTN